MCWRSALGNIPTLVAGSLGKDSLVPGAGVVRGSGHGRVSAHSSSRWVGNDLLPPGKLQMDIVWPESLQSY